MDFLQQLWNASEPVYKEIIEHPFNTELAAGTLDPGKFRFYVSQDAVYIGEYSRALAVLAARAADHSTLIEFIDFAKEGLGIERALHDHFMDAFQVKKAETLALSTEAYANFLLTTVAYKSFEEGLAALLPCFWLYNEVALDIRQKATSGNPYQKWIDTYAGVEFDATTKRLKDLTNEMASEAAASRRNSMLQLFVRSARYEWFFWDSAYQERYWVR